MYKRGIASEEKHTCKVLSGIENTAKIIKSKDTWENRTRINQKRGLRRKKYDAM